MLDVHKVTGFAGEPKGNEGQPIIWVNPESLDQYTFPAANQPIIKALTLPRVCAITGAFQSLDDFSEKFSRLCAYKHKMVQLRINYFSFAQHTNC